MERFSSTDSLNPLEKRKKEKSCLLKKCRKKKEEKKKKKKKEINLSFPNEGYRKFASADV